MGRPTYVQCAIDAKRGEQKRTKSQNDDDDHPRPLHEGRGTRVEPEDDSAIKTRMDNNEWVELTTTWIPYDNANQGDEDIHALGAAMNYQRRSDETSVV
ncbi:hypothetical protein Y032_0018g3515 [Ancylostoma ceylanicum]|uniref:Uncharacterized protein n=1 Tax=Ancylostoma ceylanicum TaxID=53326 RepID=A0A016V3B5_9BILA|nr:hypothetical protein Y032_0018g3515 [Ancylostoma ceylanicum]